MPRGEVKGLVETHGFLEALGEIVECFASLLWRCGVGLKSYGGDLTQEPP